MITARGADKTLFIHEPSGRKIIYPALETRALGSRAEQRNAPLPGEIKFLKERSCAPATLRLQSRVIRRRIMQPVGRTGRDFIERVMDGAATSERGSRAGSEPRALPLAPLFTQL
jgi:hypothetical protein